MFLDEFQDFRHSFGDSKGEVIVMADFKFISTTSTAVKVTSLLNGCCLRQLINQPNHLVQIPLPLELICSMLCGR